MLLTAHNLSKAYGAQTLFADVGLSIDSGDRIGLIGPNGAGKTTLLNILAGRMAPDTGTVACRRGLRIGVLEQSPQLRDDASVHDNILDGFIEVDSALESWERDDEARRAAARMQLDGATIVGTLSGGWKKRVALARELMRSPDLLLLDEPTNHLDVETIIWLESLLASLSCALVTITHDRLFLERVATRMWELDRRNPNGLLSVTGRYSDYLAAKEQLMHAQQRHEDVLRNTLRRETEWLRSGTKARTTKQHARIERALDLGDTVDELSARNRTRTAAIDFAHSALPKRLLEAKGIRKSYGATTIVDHLDVLLRPGTRIGLLGRNGAGKSTLIRVLLGQEAPDAGTVFHADTLQVAYFGQQREALDPARTLCQTLCPDGDYVEYRGQSVHIKSYLDRFLFRPTQMELPVGRLSGGEQSRILIAQLMLQPANLLVLDEPTNDLDLATLEVLQNCLIEFPGAIVLVTHDRYFLDQVATTLLAFPERHSPEAGHLQAFADITQWEAWHTASARRANTARKADVAPSDTASTAAKPRSKLSYKEQREFDAMEATIEAAEAAVHALDQALISPDNASNAAELTRLTTALAAAHAHVEQLYARWAELSARITPTGELTT